MADKHTRNDLLQMQSLPLSAKIQMTKRRISEWVEYFGEDGVYVSFSGGKDSTVLLDLVRKSYPDIPAVFVDTGLEYPEIREFVRTFENVVWLKPKMNFRQVIEKYGYPFFSKEISECIAESRKYIKILTDRQTDRQTEVHYAYRIADMIGVDRRKNKGNKSYQMLKEGNIPSEILEAPVRIKQLFGVKCDQYGDMYDRSRYLFMLEAPFEVSNMCCKVMKKAPVHSYSKETGRKPITAQMADESRLRTSQWLQNGCNAFEAKNPVQKQKIALKFHPRLSRNPKSKKMPKNCTDAPVYTTYTRSRPGHHAKNGQRPCHHAKNGQRPGHHANSGRGEGRATGR